MVKVGKCTDRVELTKKTSHCKSRDFLRKRRLKRAKVLESVKDSLLNKFSISQYRKTPRETLLGQKAVFRFYSHQKYLKNFSASLPTRNHKTKGRSFCSFREIQIVPKITEPKNPVLLFYPNAFLYPKISFLFFFEKKSYSSENNLIGLENNLIYPNKNVKI